MENKYYTPDIEDIRIGYEGEINWSRGYSETFVPFKITVQNEDFAYTGLLSEIVDAMDDGYAEVRTPYLTKKQIEAEGWEDMIGYLYKNYRRLNFNSETNKLQIYDMFNNIFYVGKCRCINDFRYITKLLGI